MRAIKHTSRGRDKMPRVDVVPASKGKFKVLVNFIQQGIEYSTEEQAKKEANTILSFYTKG